MRYNQILPLIAYHKPKVIAEVGTWNGLRAIMMATEALKHQKKVLYLGFDLFEDATDETDQRELSVKRHSSLGMVKKTLSEFKKENPGFQFKLTKGDTRETLKDPIEKIDLAFIDGGHSIETIENDYQAMKSAKVIILDDFYEGRDTEAFGCNQLVSREKALVLPQKDPVAGGGTVQMAVLPRNAWPKQNIVVKTKNCVPDEEIHRNIKYSTTKIKNWVVECRPHDETAVIVSGGPSLKDHLEEIRQQEGKIICVKHAHDLLLENDIVPWACMLLDPRSHVQDFIENPHQDIIYFTASMCHPTTLDRLLERNVRVWGYNAHVGAGEDTVLEPGHILIGGGSTSAVRGVSVLNALGFRKFRLYGFDSCYTEEVDFTQKTKMGTPKYMKVEVSGRKFVTDSELIAQAQDFDKLLQVSNNMEIEVVGDGMIPHIWQVGRKILPEFGDLIG